VESGYLDVPTSIWFVVEISSKKSERQAFGHKLDAFAADPPQSHGGS
jgi:hypothetical protein